MGYPEFNMISSGMSLHELWLDEPSPLIEEERFLEKIHMIDPELMNRLMANIALSNKNETQPKKRKIQQGHNIEVLADIKRRKL